MSTKDTKYGYCHVHKSGQRFRKILNVNLTEYPQETTIHGLKYLTRRKQSWTERIFWTIIMIVSMTCLTYFMYKIIAKWIEFPVMITENTRPTYIFEIPFPAVTICPAIKTKRVKFNVELLYDELQKISNITPIFDAEYRQRFILASQICRASFENYSQTMIGNMFGKVNEELQSDKYMDSNWSEILHEMSPKHVDVLKACALSTWDENKNNHLGHLSQKNCEHLFSTIITNEGLCFTFNTISDVLKAESLHSEFSYHDIKQPTVGWNPELGYNKYAAYPFKAIVKGNVFSSQNGLKIQLLANLSDRTSICHPISLGYKILLHSPSAYPNSYEKYLPIDYGKEYKISIQPKTITTAANLKSYHPENRQCYFQEERALKYYTYYNENNCKLECYANYTRDMFGGPPFSSPRDASTQNSIIPQKDYGWEFPDFYGLLYEHKKLYNFLINGTNKFDANTDCNCLSECNSIRYEYDINKSNVEVIEANHAESVTTSIEIIFDDPNFVGQTRIKTYKFVTFISNFGGLLGLFMGGSLLSVFEFIYFVAIRNYY